MLVEDQRLSARLRRPLTIVLVVLVVLVAPTWLWLVRGRRLPVRVLVSANRYVAPAGAKVALTARIMPVVQDAKVLWSGTGVAGRGSRASWKLPHQPGVYTASLTVRRAGSVASDAISVRVITPAQDARSVDRPSPRPAPPADLPRCQPGLTGRRATLHGQPCLGANIVAQLEPTPHQQAWFWWADTPGAPLRGPMANLRLRHNAAARDLVVAIHEQRRRCIHLTHQRISVLPCTAGPSRELFADFSWQLISPGVFRLAAKPPRIAHDDRRVVYRWAFGDGKARELSEPATVHRFQDNKSQHLVTLLVQVGQHQARAVKAVTDRSRAPQ